MATQNYTSVVNTDALTVPVKAATVYHAHEQSLFLGGELIPVVNTPTGVLQVPELAEAQAATVIGSETSSDIETTLAGSTKNTLTCDLFASRSVVRDLGALDANEIGRVLGVAVAKAFDQSVFTALDSAGDTTFDSTPASVDDIIDAAAVIRGNGEMGQLYAVMNPTQIAALLKEIGTDAFAGSDYQNTALRNGAVGSIAGVQIFQSARIATQVSGETVAGYMFGTDAMRIAMQKNVDIEIGRRAAAVGNDVVASLHAKAALIDPNRAVRLVDTTA